MPRHSPYALLRLNFSKRISRFSLLGSRSILNCLSFVNKYLLGFLFALKKLPFSLLLNLHLSVKLYFTHFFGKTYLISFKLIKSVLFYLFVLLFNILYSVFNEHIRNFFVPWSAWMDSNHRPHAYQACALATWATGRRLTFQSSFLSLFLRLWWRWGGSNPWPPACKAGALPTELHPHKGDSIFKQSLKAEQQKL